MSLFINKFLEVVNKIYRKEILKIVLKHDFLKDKCKDIILFIFCKFSKYKLIPPLKKDKDEEEEEEEEEDEEEDESFGQFLDDNEYLPIFDENINKNEYLREVLSYIFELKLRRFFEHLDKIKVNIIDHYLDNIDI